MARVRVDWANIADNAWGAVQAHVAGGTSPVFARIVGQLAVSQDTFASVEVDDEDAREFMRAMQQALPTEHVISPFVVEF